MDHTVPFALRHRGAAHAPASRHERALRDSTNRYESKSADDDEGEVPFHVGDHIDVLDTVEKWSEAQVIQVRRETGTS
jgi:hypothetical protein